MTRVETRDFAPLFDGITMRVIGHDDIAIQAQRPRLDTVCQAIDNNITILVAGENINPINYCRCYEMRCILVSYFVSFTHDTNVGIYACIRQSEIATRVGRSQETTPIIFCWNTTPIMRRLRPPWEHYAHHGTLRLSGEHYAYLGNTTPIVPWLEHYGHHEEHYDHLEEHYDHLEEHYDHQGEKLIKKRRLPPILASTTGVFRLSFNPVATSTLKKNRP